MKIDTDSNEMKWILLKFLKDSLDFLADDHEAKKTPRKVWAKTWMMINLTDEQIAQWMPRDDN